MTYASSIFKDLTTARAEVTNQISSLQEDLGHIDATMPRTIQLWHNRTEERTMPLPKRPRDPIAGDGRPA